MSKKSMKPVSLAVGAALVTSLTAGNLSADTTTTNPFAMNELSGGYMQLADASSTAKPDQGSNKDGDKKPEKEGKCGEGKCGGAMKKNVEDKSSEEKSDKEGSDTNK
ncbi:MAG: hypothetical protein H0X02_05440 [Nitrosomonas sp.]|nr:hypothetical protein [Nitrosomonas sp.]